MSQDWLCRLNLEGIRTLVPEKAPLPRKTGIDQSHRVSTCRSFDPRTGNLGIAKTLRLIVATDTGNGGILRQANIIEKNPTENRTIIRDRIIGRRVLVRMTRS